MPEWFASLEFLSPSQTSKVCARPDWRTPKCKAMPTMKAISSVRFEYRNSPPELRQSRFGDLCRFSASSELQTVRRPRCCNPASYSAQVGDLVAAFDVRRNAVIGDSNTGEYRLTALPGTDRARRQRNINSLIEIHSRLISWRNERECAGVDMRLSHELQKDLVARLEAIAKEAPTSPAFRDLPAIDRWVIGIIFVASILAAIMLR